MPRCKLLAPGSIRPLCALFFCIHQLFQPLALAGAPSGAEIRRPDLLADAQAAHHGFAAWAQNQAGALTPDELAAGVRLAQARARAMRALMEADPAEFVRQAMSGTERDQFPAEVRQHIEQRVKGRGSFGVYCNLPGAPEDPGRNHSHGAGISCEVRMSDGRSYQAFPFGDWKDEQTVYEAEIEGIALEDGLALGDSPSPKKQTDSGQVVTSYSPTLTGPNTVLYIIARFSDQTNYPVSDATALSHMTVVSNFWMNNSGGTVYTRGLVNTHRPIDIVQVTLPQPASYAATYNSSFGSLLSDARAAASAAGFNYANYNLDVVVTTGSGFSYAGRAYIGAQGAHLVAGHTSLRTAGHELGHNLGLYHANFWRTDSCDAFGKDSVPNQFAFHRQVRPHAEHGWESYDVRKTVRGNSRLYGHRLGAKETIKLVRPQAPAIGGNQVSTTVGVVCPIAQYVAVTIESGG